MTTLLRRWPRVKSGEMYELTMQFNEKFGDREKFLDVDFIRWVREQGYEPNPYFHPMLKTLSKSGQKKRMGEHAFRIKNVGWHQWRKEAITTDILMKVQTETRNKAEQAVATGVARHEAVKSILSARPLDNQEQMVVRLADNAMKMAQTMTSQLCQFSDEMVAMVNQMYNPQLGERTEPAA